jgi:hypothetical protein
MADSKISALPASTTPLAGTEVLPIVQSSTTRQVSVANLTAGRAISATQITLTTGNVIVASGQGIDFAATSGTGTSELLNDYEEGTWTPNQGGDLVVVGTFSSSGTYTKVGNMVTVQAHLAATTSIAWSSNPTIVSTNLPFVSASGREFSGTGHSQNYTTIFTTFAGGSSTIFAIGAQPAVASVDLSLTYFV